MAKSKAKKTTETADPTAEVEEAPEADATVDGDGDGDGTEEPDELTPEDELSLTRLTAALATLDDESLRRGLAGITEKQRQDLAGQLNLPKATMHLGDALTPLVRRKLRGLPIERQHAVATAITNRANDATVAALGDERSEDPSREDLEEVLPAVVEEHGVELVRLMLAAYGVSDAPCRDAMRSLLDTDEYAVPDVGDGTEEESELPSFGLVATTPKSKAKVDPERAKVLEQRKAAKAERRAAAAHERAAKAAAVTARREALHAAKRSTGHR